MVFGEVNSPKDTSAARQMMLPGKIRITFEIVKQVTSLHSLSFVWLKENRRNKMKLDEPSSKKPEAQEPQWKAVIQETFGNGWMVGWFWKKCSSGESKGKGKTREEKTVKGDGTVSNGGGWWSQYPVSLMAEALLSASRTGPASTTLCSAPLPQNLLPLVWTNWRKRYVMKTS